MRQTYNEFSYRKGVGEGGAGADFSFQRKRSGREGAGPQRDDGVCPSAG